jgi:archaellum component FlaC
MTTDERLEKLEKALQDLKALYMSLWRLFRDTEAEPKRVCKEDHERMKILENNVDRLEWLVMRLQSTVEDVVQDNRMQTTVSSTPKYAKSGDLYDIE